MLEVCRRGFLRVGHVLVPVVTRVRKAVGRRHKQILSSVGVDQFPAHFCDGIVEDSTCIVGALTHKLDLEGRLEDS